MRHTNSIAWCCDFIRSDGLFTELVSSVLHICYLISAPGRADVEIHACLEGGWNRPPHPTQGFVRWTFVQPLSLGSLEAATCLASHVLLCEMNVNAQIHPFTLFSSEEEKIRGSGSQREHRTSLFLKSRLVLAGVRHGTNHGVSGGRVLHCSLLTWYPPHSAQTEMLGISRLAPHIGNSTKTQMRGVGSASYGGPCK